MKSLLFFISVLLVEALEVEYAKGFSFKQGQALELHIKGMPPLPMQTTPLRWLVLSTTQIQPMADLRLLSFLVGFSNPELVVNQEFQKMVLEGKIQSVGMDQSLNLEKVVALKPDLILSYPYQKQVNLRLKELGFLVIETAEYLETHPLGYAEWIKLFGFLSHQLPEAEKLFQQIKKNYLALSQKASLISSRPSVFMHLCRGGVFYMPSADTFWARLIQDAGGLYLFTQKGQGSLNLTFEQVLLKAREADFWLNPGDLTSLKGIREQDERYALFKAFQKGLVYNNNKTTTQGNQTDFFERGMSRPDLVLADLHSIFHSQGTTLNFYQRLP